MLKDNNYGRRKDTDVGFTKEASGWFKKDFERL